MCHVGYLAVKDYKIFSVHNIIWDFVQEIISFTHNLKIDIFSLIILKQTKFADRNLGHFSCELWTIQRMVNMWY